MLTLTFWTPILNTVNDSPPTHHHKRSQPGPELRGGKCPQRQDFGSGKFFNKLHESARASSLNNFNRKIMTWPLSNPFYSLSEFIDRNVDIVF